MKKVYYLISTDVTKSRITRVCEYLFSICDTEPTKAFMSWKLSIYVVGDHADHDTACVRVYLGGTLQPNVKCCYFKYFISTNQAILSNLGI